MRKVLLLILVCILHNGKGENNAFPLSFYPFNIPVAIYADSTTVNPMYYLSHDEANEIIFDGTLLGSSTSRFKCDIRNSEDDTKLITGWVDKENVVVWPRLQAIDVGGKIINDAVELFHDPGQGIPTVLSSVSDEAFQLLDVAFVDGIAWVKVIIHSSGKRYVGWIDRFCSNIYNSCA